MVHSSHVRPSATPWTAAFQAPPSMGFSRQEYWSGVPSPSPDSFSFFFLILFYFLTLQYCIVFAIYQNAQVVSRIYFPSPCFLFIHDFKIFNIERVRLITYQNDKINSEKKNFFFSGVINKSLLSKGSAEFQCLYI